MYNFSANRRILIPESFLIADYLITTVNHIFKGLIVNQSVITRNLNVELPFMATENILMSMVELGENRQDIHEILRQLSHEQGDAIKNGIPNKLIDKIKEHPQFSIIKDKVH